MTLVAPVRAEFNTLRNARGEPLNTIGETVLAALTRLNRQKCEMAGGRIINAGTRNEQCTAVMTNGNRVVNPGQPVRLTDIQAVAEPPAPARTLGLLSIVGIGLAGIALTAALVVALR